MLAASWRSFVAHPVTQALLCPTVVHALAVVAGERATAPTVVPPIGEADKLKDKRGRDILTISRSRFDEQQLYGIVKGVGPCDVVQVART